MGNFRFEAVRESGAGAAEAWNNSATIVGIFAECGTPMGQPKKIPGWLEHLVGSLGGGGLFVVAFLDSSVLSFPFITDALVIQLSMTHPGRMPYYAAMSALGSLGGCIWLYLLARAGGEAYFHRHARSKAAKIKRWVDRNGFFSAFVPAILPPPFPFKIFVLAEGVFQVPIRTFATAILLGRGLRYFAEGILAVRYGNRVLVFLTAHGAAFALLVVAVLVLLYVTGRVLLHESSPAE
ncbi:MAG: VTT domain-containing protein [Candidatus Acidiferrales bacterium]